MIVENRFCCTRQYGLNRLSIIHTTTVPKFNGVALSLFVQVDDATVVGALACENEQADVLKYLRDSSVKISQGYPPFG
jgi:hypothetical protein